MTRMQPKYRPIVKAASLSAGAVGVPGAFSFGLDVVAMTGIWGAMTLKIADESAHPVDRFYAAKLAGAVISGASAYVGGSKLAMKSLHFLLPVVGSAAAVGVNSTLNWWFTWRVGRGLVTVFDKPSLDLDDFQNTVFALLGILSPLPSATEIGEIATVMGPSTIVKPELFRMFESARGAQA